MSDAFRIGYDVPVKILLVVSLIVVASAGLAYGNAPLSLWSCDALRAEWQSETSEQATLTEAQRGRPLVSMRDYEADLGYPQARINGLESWSAALSNELRHRC